MKKEINITIFFLICAAINCTNNSNDNKKIIQKTITYSASLSCFVLFCGFIASNLYNYTSREIVKNYCAIVFSILFTFNGDNDAILKYRTLKNAFCLFLLGLPVFYHAFSKNEEYNIPLQN
jgi:hypothetical protein